MAQMNELEEIIRRIAGGQVREGLQVSREMLEALGFVPRSGSGEATPQTFSEGAGYRRGEGGLGPQEQPGFGRQPTGSDRSTILQASQPQLPPTPQVPESQAQPWRWRPDPETRQGTGGFLKRVGDVLMGVGARFGSRFIQPHVDKDYAQRVEAEELARENRKRMLEAAQRHLTIADYQQGQPTTIEDGVKSFQHVVVKQGLPRLSEGIDWPPREAGTTYEELVKVTQAGINALAARGNLPELVHKAESGKVGDPKHPERAKLDTEMALAAATAAAKRRLHQQFITKAVGILEQPEKIDKERDGRSANVRRPLPGLTEMGNHLTRVAVRPGEWRDTLLSYPEETRDQLDNVARQVDRPSLQLACELVEQIERTQKGAQLLHDNLSRDRSGNILNSADRAQIQQFVALPPEEALREIIRIAGEDETADPGPRIQILAPVIKRVFVKELAKKYGLTDKDLMEHLKQLTSTNAGEPAGIELAIDMANAVKEYERRQQAVKKAVLRFIQEVKGKADDRKGYSFKRLLEWSCQPDVVDKKLSEIDWEQIANQLDRGGELDPVIRASLARASLRWLAQQVNVAEETRAYEVLADDAATPGYGGKIREKKKGGELGLEIRDLVPPRAQALIVAAIDGGGLAGVLAGMRDIGVGPSDEVSPLMADLSRDPTNAARLERAFLAEFRPDRQETAIVQDLATLPGIEMLGVIGKKGVMEVVLDNLIYGQHAEGYKALKARVDKLIQDALRQVDERPNEALIYLALIMENARKAIPPGRWGELPTDYAEVWVAAAADLALAMIKKYKPKTMVEQGPIKDGKAIAQHEAAEVAMSLTRSFVRNVPPPVGLEFVKLIYEKTASEFILNKKIVAIAQALSNHEQLNDYPEVEEEWHDLLRQSLAEVVKIISPHIETYIQAWKEAEDNLVTTGQREDTTPLHSLAKLILMLPQPPHSLLLEGDSIPISQRRGDWRLPGLDVDTFTQRYPVPLQESVERLELPGLTNRSTARDVALALWGIFLRQILDKIQRPRETRKQAEDLGYKGRVVATLEQEQVLSEWAGALTEWLQQLTEEIGLTIEGTHPRGEFPHSGNVNLEVVKDSLPFNRYVAQLAANVGIDKCAGAIEYYWEWFVKEQPQITDEEVDENVKREVYDRAMKELAEEWGVDVQSLINFHQAIRDKQGDLLKRELSQAIVERRELPPLYKEIFWRGLDWYDQQIGVHSQLFSRHAAPVPEYMIRELERGIRRQKEAFGVE